MCVWNVGRRSRKDVILMEKTFKNMEHMKFVNNLEPTMRARFLELCWIEEYEPKRVLVNQYRKSESFYVVISGTLLCTYR